MTSCKACTNEEYESLRNSRPYWNCAMWRVIRRKPNLIVTDWRQWWKEVSSRIWEWRILQPEMENLKQAPWSRIIGWNSVNKEVLKIVGKGKLTGSVQKETDAVSVTISISVGKVHHQIRLRILSCSKMSENNREPEVPEARVPVEECFDGFARITSKELAPIHSVKKWHPPECLFYKSENGRKLGEKCSCAHRQVDEQPSKKSQKNGDKSAVAKLKSTRQVACVFQDMEPPKYSSILRKSSNILKPIRCVRLTKAVLRHANIRDQNPSLGMICPGFLSSAQPQRPKNWGLVSGGDGMARARCPWSSVENGKMYPEMKGETKNNILLTFGK